MPSASPSTSDRAPGAPVLPPLRVGWLDGLQPYPATWDLQKAIHEERVHDLRPDTLLLLEHAPVITVGRNGSAANLVAPEAVLRSRGIDLVHTDRGGDVTYHGPGQLVGYAIVDLKRLHNDVHRFLREIEEGLIRSLGRWGIASERNPGKTGVWSGGEKIASIGLKASHWVTMHGFALNVSTDLSAFDLIVPCGIRGCAMTSMERLSGKPIDLHDVGEAAAAEMARLWGRSLAREGRDPWPT